MPWSGWSVTLGDFEVEYEVRRLADARSEACTIAQREADASGEEVAVKVVSTLVVKPRRNVGVGR